MLPKIAEGDANKLWIVPSEIGEALEGLGSTLGSIQGIPQRDRAARATRVDYGHDEPVDAGARRRPRAVQDPRGGRGTRSRRPSASANPATPRRRRRRHGRCAGVPSRRRAAGRRTAGRTDADRADAARRSVTLLEASPSSSRASPRATINTIVGSGTLITFPTLLAIGYPPVLANVSNTVGLVPGSLSGVLGYRRELAGQRTAAGPAREPPRLLGGLTGAPAAARAARRGVHGHRAGADRARAACWCVVQPWISRADRRPAEAPAARLRGGSGVSCTLPGSTAATSARPRACC